MLRSGEPLREPSRLCIPFGLGAAANGCLVLLGPRAGRLPAARPRALARDLGDLAALAVHRLQADARAGRAGRAHGLAAARRPQHDLEPGAAGRARRRGARGGGHLRARATASSGSTWRTRTPWSSAPGSASTPGFSVDGEIDPAGGAAQGARDPLQPGAGPRDGLGPAARRAEPRVHGALGREDLPLAAAAVRRRDARSARDLRDRARTPLHRRGAGAGARPGQPGVRGGAQRARLPRPRAAQRRARGAGRAASGCSTSSASSSAPVSTRGRCSTPPAARICAILDASGCEIWAQARRRRRRVPRRVGRRRGRRGVASAAGCPSRTGR